MEYITVQFFGDNTRKYTYKCKRRNIKVNDFVIVPTPTGKQVVKVIRVNVPTPSFETKDVIRKVRL